MDVFDEQAKKDHAEGNKMMAVWAIARAYRRLVELGYARCTDTGIELTGGLGRGGLPHVVVRDKRLGAEALVVLAFRVAV